MRWWIGGGILAIAFVIGLYSASRAESALASWLGFGLSAMALIAAAMLMNQIFRDGRDRFFPDFKVREGTSVCILVAVLGVAGLGGLLIAARAPDSGLYNTGLLIAAAAIAWIFFSLRDYFNQSGNGG